MFDFQKPDSDQRYALWVLVLVVFSILVFRFRFVVIDDPYITFRFAKNLIEGQGIVFNSGEYVEGYSNFLWMLVSAFWIKIGFTDPLVAIQITSYVLMAGFFALACFGLGGRFSTEENERWFFNPVAAFLVAASYPLAVWTAGALETISYALLLFFSAVLCARAASKPGEYTAVTLGLLLVATAVSRPEGAMVFALPVLALLLRPHSDARKSLLLAFGIGLIIFLLYTIWRYLYFGTVIPNTVSAKVGGQISETIKYGLKYGWEYAFGLGGVLGVLALVSLYKVVKGLMSGKEISEKHRLLILLTSLIILQSLFTVLVGGDWMPGLRFIVPLIIPLCYLASETIKTWKPKFIVAFIGIAVISAPIEASFERVQGYRILEWLRVTANGEHSTALLKQIGNDIGQRADESDVVALTEAGAVPYFSNVQVLDMFGLVDREIAQGDGGLHENFNSDIVINRKPKYILIAVSKEEGELKGVWGPDQQILDHPVFRLDYSPVQRWVRLYPNGFGVTSKPVEMVLYQRFAMYTEDE